VLGSTTIATVPGGTTPPAAQPPATVAGAVVTRSGGTSQVPTQELATTGLDADRLATSVLLIGAGMVLVGLARRARRRQA